MTIILHHASRSFRNNAITYVTTKSIIYSPVQRSISQKTVHPHSPPCRRSARHPDRRQVTHANTFRGAPRRSCRNRSETSQQCLSTQHERSAHRLHAGLRMAVAIFSDGSLLRPLCALWSGHRVFYLQTAKGTRRQSMMDHIFCVHVRAIMTDL